MLSVRRRSRDLPAPAVLTAPAEDPSIPYRDGYGLRLFDCAPQLSIVSTKGCADRWRKAQISPADSGTLEACRGCRLGALHAGGVQVRPSRYFGKPICPACRQGATRMVGNKICISCYNRRREARRGCNARGNPTIDPKGITRRLSCRVRIGAAAADLVRSTEAIDLFEVHVQAMRMTSDRVVMGFGGPLASLRQGRLF